MSNILKIENAFGDLPMTADIKWVGESYESRMNTLLSIIQEKTGGLPSANIRPIRQMTIVISERITSSMMEKFINDVRDCFGVDCFQYIVDTTTKRAYMLFDWYDREKNQCYYIYKTLQKKIEAMAMYYLDVDSVLTDRDTLRLYLKNRYRLDKDIFKCLNRSVKEFGGDKDTSQMIDIILRYIELVCKGKVK